MRPGTPTAAKDVLYIVADDFRNDIAVAYGFRNNQFSDDRRALERMRNGKRRHIFIQFQANAPPPTNFAS